MTYTGGGCLSPLLMSLEVDACHPSYARCVCLLSFVPHMSCKFCVSVYTCHHTIHKHLALTTPWRDQKWMSSSMLCSIGMKSYNRYEKFDVAQGRGMPPTHHSETSENFMVSSMVSAWKGRPCPLPKQVINLFILRVARMSAACRGA